jgi:hypothetical protein
MEAPENACNACLAALDISGRSEREIRSEIRPNSGGFAQAGAAARAASRKPAFGRFFAHVIILSGPYHPLNGRKTLTRLATNTAFGYSDTIASNENTVIDQTSILKIISGGRT